MRQSAFSWGVGEKRAEGQRGRGRIITSDFRLPTSDFRIPTCFDQLWASLPDISQQCVLLIQIFDQRNITVIPAQRYQAVGKQILQTNHLPRFNHTLRQRVSRPGKSKSIILQKARSSHDWSDLVLH